MKKNDAINKYWSYSALSRLASQGEVISGSLNVVESSRLPEVINTMVAQSIDYTFVFGFDVHARLSLQMQLQGQLCLQCERCCEDMGYELSADMLFVCVDDQTQAEKVSSDVEVLVIDSNQLNLLDLIIDELFLSLPLVAKHADDVCAFVGHEVG